MSAIVSLPVFWSQIQLPGIPENYRALMSWLLLLGEPSLTILGIQGGLITWVKVVSLVCLLGWVASWVAAALKERTTGHARWIDVAALAALVVGVVAMGLRVVESTGRSDHAFMVGKVPVVTAMAIACGATIFLWIEAALWSTIRRLGRWSDLLILLGIHLALILGMGVGITYQRVVLTAVAARDPKLTTSWQEGVIYGARFSGTYMGYVVLAGILARLLREVVALRWRRLYSIAWLSVVESTRRMWAPWVVTTVFLVVLAFTHWFLQPPRPAEMGRLFVGTLALLCSLLLTVMITLLSPLSLPYDIQQQTIYTVVSKPVRRLELIWGRMIGFMAIVTVLVFVFGGISLLYLWRTVGGTIRATEAQAAREAGQGRMRQATHLREEAAQLRTRMSAREPIKGSLTFLDSKSNFHIRGIDVGQEQSSREPRSHVEGGTPATAIWRFGMVPDPYHPQIALDRRIPVDRLITPDSIEGWLNRIYELRYQIARATRDQGDAKLSPAAVGRITTTLNRNREELKAAEATLQKLRSEDKEWMARAAAAAKAGRTTEADSLRRQAESLHSPKFPVEMTFNIYRTTKGRIGEPVMAEIIVTNPFSQERPYRNVFPIHEYYTNKHYVPATVLAGSMGALKVEIRCLSPTQYLGMAESDLYILARAGRFGTNYMKGLFGIWLQAMVLTAIGVFAGTFLSWPVALLTTIAFFIAGQVAFSFLLEFSHQTLLGGGPFESLFRLLTHDNQVSDLAPTLAVVTAKTFDSIIMPVMSRLVYIVPNFSALDVTNTVADGFEVRWELLGVNLLLALAYAFPFSIAGYFILKNREVAA